MDCKMPKYIKTDKLQDNVFVPLKLSDQIIEGTLAYTIQFLVDNKINISPFENKIKNDITGRPAYNPKVLLKLILFAYSNGIISSRSIQNLARQNIIAMVLSENTIPDFTVIADFISDMKDEISSVFVNILLVASEMDLLGNTTFAIDGCKLPTNASKENSGKFSDLQKKQKKIEEKIKYLLDTHNSNDYSETVKTSSHINKTIGKLEKKIDKIEKFLSENQKKIGKRYSENQSNITDNESAKMKTGHGVIQGYNGQALVDDKHQIIVSAEAFGQGSDNDLLEPILDKALENMKELGETDDFFKDKTVIADTGYFSEENLKSAKDKEIDAYIPDQYFRKRDIRFDTKDRHNPDKQDKISRDDFKYDSENDVVVCPNGNKLTLSRGKLAKVKNFIYKRYIGKKSFCSVCPDRTRCLRNEKTKYRIFQIAVDDKGCEYTKEMIKKIDTVKGRDIYSKRMSIVEPVFANIRTHKKLNRFTLRTKSKVNIQWLLYCIVHNIGKIMRYGDLSLLSD
jgi:transposase